MNCLEALSHFSVERSDEIVNDEGLQDTIDGALREQCAKAFDDAFELLNEDGTPAVLSLLTALADLRPLLDVQFGPGPGPILDAVVYLLEEGDQILDDDLVCSWVDFISDSIRCTTMIAALYHLCYYISRRRRCLHPQRQPGGRLPSFAIAP